MATYPATAAGEVRLTLRIPNGDGTDAPAQGYAYLFPNLRPGTMYRASNVDAQYAGKTRLVFDGSGNLEDPETGLWPKVVASNAPGATYNGLQYVLEFHLDNTLPSEQPADAYFTVPAQSFVNVGFLADTGPQPSVQTIYVNTAPILASINTTDSAVNGLFTTASTTRTTADARYLSTSQAASTYLTQTNAANTYVTDSELAAAVATVATDSGWLNLTITNGSTPFFNSPVSARYRKIGKEVTVNLGVGKGSFAADETIATLPSGYRPDQTHWFVGSYGGTARFVRVETSGAIRMDGAQSGGVGVTIKFAVV